MTGDPQRGAPVAGTLHPVQRAGTTIARHIRATTVDEAVLILAEASPAGRARVLAGATDLLLELARGGRSEVDTLVDITRIPGLDTISEHDGVVRLGPMVTHNQAVASDLVQEHLLPLAQACLELGSAQLRNRATIVGNLVTASPANDTISALLALGAAVEATSVRGHRLIDLDRFYPGFRLTALAPDELVTAVVVPALAPNQRGIFAKLGNRAAQAISVVHVAAVVALDGRGVVTGARVALGSVAATVELCQPAADALIGQPLTVAAITAAADAAAASVTPIDDVRATADYRSATIPVLVRRALGVLAEGSERRRWPRDPPLLWGRSQGRSPTGDGYGADLGAGDEISVTVNGQSVRAAGAVGVTLLDWLRDQAGLAGTKEGCAEGECGACTVHLDGMAVMSCLVPAVSAAGSEVVTIEGLAAPAPGQPLHPIQQAFVDHTAVQCGFCIPGFLMAAAKLLEERPDPAIDEIGLGLSGNLCRCTGYYAIIDATLDAAQVLAAEGPVAGAMP